MQKDPENQAFMKEDTCTHTHRDYDRLNIIRQTKRNNSGLGKMNLQTVDTESHLL